MTLIHSSQMQRVISLRVEQLLISQINIYIAFCIKILCELDNLQDCDKLDRVVLNSNRNLGCLVYNSVWFLFD